MDINDYSQKYSNLKSDFAEQAKKLKDGYDKTLKQKDEVNEAQRADQKKSYDVTTEKMSENLEDVIDQAKESFANKNRSQKERYISDISKEKEQFARERAETQGKFNTRLSNLENTFKSTTEENEKQYETGLNRQSSQFKNTEGMRKEKFDKEQTAYRNHLDKSVHQMGIDQKNEINGIQQLNQNEKHQIVEGLQRKNIQDLSRSKAGYLNLKESNELEAINKQENFERSQKNLLAAKNEELGKVVELNQEGFSEINRRNAMSEASSLKTFNDQKRLDERSHNEDVQRLRNQITEIHDQNGEGSYSSLIKKDVQENQDRNINKLHKALEEREIAGALEKDDLRKNYTETVGEIKKEYVKEIDQKIKADNAVYGKQLLKAKQNKDQTIDTYEEKLSGLNNQYWRDMNNQKSQLQSEIDIRTGAYAESFKRLSEDKNDSLDSLKTIQAEEKKEYIMSQRAENNENVEEIRDNMFKDFNKEIENYKNILKSEKEKSAKMEEDYSRMMGNQRDQFTQELSLVKRDGEDRRLEERRNAQRAIYQIDTESKDKMKEFRSDMEKRVAQDKMSFEIEKSKIVDNYERQIKDVRAADANENRIQVNRLEHEISSQKLANDIKVEGLISKYEDKLETLRNENLRLKELKNTRADNLG